MTDDWENPEPFYDLIAPEIPANILRGELGGFTKALADSAEVPEALPLMVILGVISCCVAKHVFVSPKQGWMEPVNIYSIIALPPANNKSLILKRSLAPLKEWQRLKREAGEKEQKKSISERKTQEKLIESLRGSYIKEKDPAKQKRLLSKIADLEASLPEKKPLLKLFSTDETPESLGQSLADQKGRFAIFSDEGGIIEILSGLYSKGAANVDILLKGIDGGYVSVRRKDREYDLNPYLTLILPVQPQILMNMAEKKAFSGNGTLERFLYVIPKSRLGYRTHNTAPVPDMLEHGYHLFIKRLLDKYCDKQNEIATKLTLSPEALSAWKNFQLEVEVELRPSGKLSLCSGWGGKISGFALRIAGLLHVAEEVSSNEISNDTMSRALNLARLLIEHALVAYGIVGMEPRIADAKEVWQWIKDHGEEEYKRGEITLALRSRKVGKREKLDTALKTLCEMNYLRTRVEATRKPTIIYKVNPLAKEL